MDDPTDRRREPRPTRRGPRLASGRSGRWALWDRFDAPDYDDPQQSYVSRWRLVQTPWFGIFLHRYSAPDPRDTLHDHPWPFLSIVFRGGYRERRRYDTAPVTVRWLNLKRSTDVHAIVELLRVPTWTLLFVGPRRPEWGYVDRDGTWTRSDEHPHGAEFAAAMAARQADDR